jgi:CubicO group peptidase (beta-lactamase class C family)
MRTVMMWLGLSVFCAQTASCIAADVWPGAEWERVTPAEAGWSADALKAARRSSEQMGTAAFVAIHHGRMVASWGNIDTRLEIYSARKSLLSALIGTAVADGRIKLAATLATLDIDDAPPSLSDTEKQATVRQLLQARSGVYHDALFETKTMAARRPARGSHPPGTFWYYNNWDFNTLGGIYEKAVGTSIFEAFQQRIAAPIGMQDYRPSDGRYVTGAASRYPAYPFHMTARDLARFGLLYARGGRWADVSLVSPGWIKESTTAWSETERHAGYGYLWWVGLGKQPGAIMHLSEGGFWAHGNKGQFVVVDPVRDLVVVHLTDGAVTVSEPKMSELMHLVLVAAHEEN